MTWLITWLLKGWLSRWALTAEGEIKDGWRWMVSSPVHALLVLCIALALLCALFWHEWSVKARQVAHLSGEIAQIKAAQRTATENQIHINQLPAIAAANIARQSDAQAPAFYAAVASAATAHDRVVRPCPASASGAAPVPVADPTAPVDDRSPTAAVMVSRPKADDDLIVAAAGRAAQMHADAQALIDAGVAVVDGR